MFCKIECFCHPVRQAKAGKSWTNNERSSLEGSSLIMRFFVRNYFEGFLRKTTLFDFV